MDTINACKYLFLVSLTEPDEGGVRLVVQEARAEGAMGGGDPGEELLPPLDELLGGCTSIEHGPGCRVFTLYWPDYIAYAVENESYACNAPGDESTGQLLRLYSQSAYLDYLGKASFASAEYPGPFKHWGVICLDHVVNVASADEPVISVTIA